MSFIIFPMGILCLIVKN